MKKLKRLIYYYTSKQKVGTYSLRFAALDIRLRRDVSTIFNRVSQTHLYNKSANKFEIFIATFYYSIWYSLSIMYNVISCNIRFNIIYKYISTRVDNRKRLRGTKKKMSISPRV